jgi:integrase
LDTSFFRFCVESDYLDRDPAHVLRTPKKREALPDVLDRAELSRLLDVPGREGVWKRVHAGKRERDRLLLALFAYGVWGAFIRSDQAARAYSWISPPSRSFRRIVAWRVGVAS